MEKLQDQIHILTAAILVMIFMYMILFIKSFNRIEALEKKVGIQN